MEIRKTADRVEELHSMLLSDPHPIIVDVRPPMAQAQGRIPGAITLSAGDALPTQAADKEVIVVCDCPNDASAAAVSKGLMQSGYGRVRPPAGASMPGWTPAML